ncbi:uncharacterized protein G2W53_010094 [Senna tora]|uniref:Uncharacterized protein n=1 Tax=Senna tora TaxID=362788 RepID=A0A834WYN1_9FABA|nr:uncharacterized protein G2W53_010094 [Senna tora]
MTSEKELLAMTCHSEFRGEQGQKFFPQPEKETLI